MGKKWSAAHLANFKKAMAAKRRERLNAGKPARANGGAVEGLPPQLEADLREHYRKELLKELLETLR